MTDESTRARPPLVPDPSDFLIALHVVQWTALTCTLIGLMVLLMLH